MRLEAEGEGSAVAAGRDSPTVVLQQLSGNSRLLQIWKKKLSPQKRERSWHWIGCKTLIMACSWSTVTLASLHLCQGHSSCHYLGQKGSCGNPCKPSTLTSTLPSHKHHSLHNFTQLGTVHSASLNQS